MNKTLANAIRKGKEIQILESERTNEYHYILEL